MSTAVEQDDEGGKKKKQVNMVRFFDWAPFKDHLCRAATKSSQLSSNEYIEVESQKKNDSKRRILSVTLHMLAINRCS